MNEVANSLGISESNLFKIIKKDSFEVSYLIKAADLFKLPLSYFIENTAESSTNTQSGFANISGSGNKQKIMPGAESTGHTASLSNTGDLAAKLTECQQMNQALTRELDITRELVKSKDEMIALLRGSRDRPN